MVKARILIVLVLGLAGTVALSCSEPESVRSPFSRQEGLGRATEQSDNSKPATTGYRRDVEPVGTRARTGEIALRGDCIDFMAFEYIEALTTNDCRTVLDWEWCPVMAVAMELRVENGQTIGRLAALWERDCL